MGQAEALCASVKTIMEQAQAPCASEIGTNTREIIPPTWAFVMMEQVNSILTWPIIARTKEIGQHT